MNTDTLLNGTRRSVYGVWSPDSRHFATILTDNRAVKDLWVIDVTAKPRPTLETYKYQMQRLINYVKNHMQAIPILVKIPPTNGASSSFYSSINDWVENSGELYIDMCTPLTVDGLGLTRNSDLFLADGTHPNVDGHSAIFNEMKIDVPELFV
jgi:lysophospholipase L1-like esterase